MLRLGRPTASYSSDPTWPRLLHKPSSAYIVIFGSLFSSSFSISRLSPQKTRSHTQIRSKGAEVQGSHGAQRAGEDWPRWWCGGGSRALLCTDRTLSYVLAAWDRCSSTARVWGCCSFHARRRSCCPGWRGGASRRAAASQADGGRTSPGGRTPGPRLGCGAAGRRSPMAKAAVRWRASELAGRPPLPHAGREGPASSCFLEFFNVAVVVYRCCNNIFDML
jgi:hypothetical protein